LFSEKYKKQEKKYEDRRKLSVDKRVYMIDEETYAYETPFCSKYYSRDVSVYGYNSKMIIDEESIHHDIFVQRYYYKSYGKLSQTEFEEYDTYSNFSNRTKTKSVKILKLMTLYPKLYFFN